MSQIIHKVYEISATPEVVWRALTDHREINAWGGGPSHMDAVVGGAFKMWDGEIWGTNTAVESEHELHQDWSSSDMPKGSPASQAVFRLKATKSGTQLELTHENVPAEIRDSVDEGWDIYYLGRLKEFCEAQ